MKMKRVFVCTTATYAGNDIFLPGERKMGNFNWQEALWICKFWSTDSEIFRQFSTLQFYDKNDIALILASANFCQRTKKIMVGRNQKNMYSFFFFHFSSQQQSLFSSFESPHAKKVCTHANNVFLCYAQESRVLLFFAFDFFFCNKYK